MKHIFSRKIKARDPVTGKFEGINAFAAESTEEYLDKIQKKGEDTLVDVEAQIVKKGAETLATIPDDYTELANGVDQLSEEIANNGTVIPLEFPYAGYIEADGTFSDLYPSYRTTDYIENNHNIVVSGIFQNLRESNYINCYDENKNFIGGVISGSEDSYTYDNEKIELPLGTCYIRVTDAATTYATVCIIRDFTNVNNIVQTTGNHTKMAMSQKAVTEMFDAVTEIFDNVGVFVELDFPYTGYINGTGSFVEMTTSFKTTDYIETSNNIVVTGIFRNLSDITVYYINCYDEDKKHIGGVVQGRAEEYLFDKEKIVLPFATRYIRITDALINGYKTLLIRRDLSSSINSCKYDYLFSGCFGFATFSKFATVGDSLSVGYYTDSAGNKHGDNKTHSWSAYIEKTKGCKAYWTGKSGATCKSWLESTSNEWGLNYCKTIGTMPLYVICMGANESASGTVDDIGTDNDTLYVHISKVIIELRAISPNSFIVCTGISRKQSARAVNAVYRDVCKHFDKCYYLDCETEFNSEPLDSYYNDFHYTASGYSAIANLFDYKLAKVMKENIEDFKAVDASAT